MFKVTFNHQSLETGIKNKHIYMQYTKHCDQEASALRKVETQ